MLTRHMMPVVLVALSTISSAFGQPFAVEMAEQTNQPSTHVHAAASPSTTLTMIPVSGDSLKFDAAAFKVMPHVTVNVRNEHTNTDERYSGVALSFLLSQLHVPTGKEIKGKAFLFYLVAEGTDHYRVLYSLTEVDPVTHSGDVIVADTLNGLPLTSDGVFKLISTEDKRPARWVRNLSSITIKSAE